MNDQRKSSIAEPASNEDRAATPGEPEAKGNGSGHDSGAPVAIISMIAGDDAGFCAGDACAIPTKKGW